MSPWFPLYPSVVIRPRTLSGLFVARILGIVLPVPIPPLAASALAFGVVGLFGLPGKRKGANGKVEWKWN